MSILVDRLPKSVEIGGAEYQINTGFRTSILFEMLIRDKGIPDQVKIGVMLRQYYPVVPPDEDAAIQKILWFFNCGKKKKKPDERNKTAKSFRKDKALYSFEQDAAMIYAAFLSEYEIDLQDVEDLHWWKFSALFDALPDDTKIKQVMRIRGMDTSGLKKKEIKRLNDLKKYYALEDEETVDSRVKLAKRNARMKEYVRRRMEEVRGKNVGT